MACKLSCSLSLKYLPTKSASNNYIVYLIYCVDYLLNFRKPVTQSASGFIMVKCHGSYSYDIVISIKVDSNPKGNGARADRVV